MDQMTSRVAGHGNLFGSAGWGDNVWPPLPPAVDARTIAIPGRQHTLAGDVRRHPGFHSQFLPTDRNVLVWLPPGYHAQPWRRYPVLYLQDGQNLFDGATSVQPGLEWRVDETAQQLIQAQLVEPLIVVGIDNARQERGWEYSSPPWTQPGRADGADWYGRMLVEELKPAIDAQYRTRPGPWDTGLGGSSLGGLVALYLGLKYPHVFGKLAPLSLPGLAGLSTRVWQEISGLWTKLPLRIWLDVGTSEPFHFLVAVRSIRDALLAKGWQWGADLAYYEQPGGEHTEAAWAQRVAPVLHFLFPARSRLA